MEIPKTAFDLVQPRPRRPHLPTREERATLNAAQPSSTPEQAIAQHYYIAEMARLESVGLLLRGEEEALAQMHSVANMARLKAAKLFAPDRDNSQEAETE